MRDGDANTTYFHSMMKMRNRRNYIGASRSDNDIIEEVYDLKIHMKDFFEEKLKEHKGPGVKLDLSDIQNLSAKDNNMLVEQFLAEEIREVISSTDGSKSPGPNGFNFKFLNQCCSIVEGDIVNIVSHFHKFASLPKFSASSFITLILKKEQPMKLKDYRPISLITCVYKLISKLMARRLSRLMDKLIYVNQTAFIYG
ncbi:unnamed protein product [Lathyrus sativus]|nr:unnamed protein product [Lathyrus sativus]